MPQRLPYKSVLDKVSSFAYTLSAQLALVLNKFPFLHVIGAIETEDMEFGTGPEALAADVDDGIADEDLEALDSDEEYEDDPDALFADREEDSDSKPIWSGPTEKQR